MISSQATLYIRAIMVVKQAMTETPMTDHTSNGLTPRGRKGGGGEGASGVGGEAEKETEEENREDFASLLPENILHENHLVRPTTARCAAFDRLPWNMTRLRAPQERAEVVETVRCTGWRKHKMATSITCPAERG